MSDEDVSTYVCTIYKYLCIEIVCTLFDPICGFYFADIILIQPNNVLYIIIKHLICKLYLIF